MSGGIPSLRSEILPLGSAGVTPDLADSSTLLATTEFVKSQGYVSSLGVIGNFTKLIGDGTTQNITVNHNLGSTNLIVNTWQTTGNLTQVFVETRILDSNNIELFFEIAPATNSINVIISKSGNQAGNTGATGPNGSTGANSTVPGPTGAQGNTGSQGNTGATGVVSNNLASNLVLPKTSGMGIEVDNASPSFPWQDLFGNITAKATTGAGTNPNWVTYRGGISGFQFAVNDEVWVEYHIPHDYLPGSNIFIHCHWSYIAASMTSGGVTWTFDATAAKGHQQQAFPAPVTLSVAQTAITSASGGQYMHHIAEVQLTATSPTANQLPNSSIEPDSLILVHCYLSANTLQGTPPPFLHFCDLHYQSTGVGTKEKAPNFYV